MGKGGGSNEEYKASEVDDESAQAVMEVLDDETKELLNGMSDDFQSLVASQKLQSDKHGVQALQTISQEENEEAMRLALEQYSKLTAPWQKEAFIKKKKAEISKKKKKKKKKS